MSGRAAGAICGTGGVAGACPGSSGVLGFLTIVALCADVRYRPEDPGALDVEDGVPPPRAAPPLLRRVVLSQSSCTVMYITGDY